MNWFKKSQYGNNKKDSWPNESSDLEYYLFNSNKDYESSWDFSRPNLYTIKDNRKLSNETIVKRIEYAKKRLEQLEHLESAIMDYLKKEKKDFFKKLWMNRLISIQKSFKRTEKTLNKYIQMMEMSDGQIW